MIKLAYSLSLGADGPLVIAAQGALRAWAIERRPKGEPGTRGYAPTGHFKIGTVNQVKHFQKLHSIDQSGIIGKRTWDLLEPFLTKTGKKLALSEWLRIHPPLTVRDKVVQAALDGYAHRFQIKYVQMRPYNWLHTGTKTAEQLYKEDCSSFAIWTYYVAGALDPGGYNFTGWGNTDSMLNHGVQVSQPQPADFVFYDNPGHVSIFIGDGLCVSNGHYPMSKVVPNYRPIRCIRSYLPRD